MKKVKRAWYRFHKKHLKKRKLRFVYWFDKKFPGKYCWADCVSWAFNSGAFNPFKIGNAQACKTESEIDAYYHQCYCGGWSKGKCWALLTDEERNAIIAQEEIINKGDGDNNLPF